MNEEAAHAELIAVVVAVTGREPRVLTIGGGSALPSGPLENGHRSLQAGVRVWVQRQTHHPIGYVEQLYTFADHRRSGNIQRISISYLALSLESASPHQGTSWRSWYDYFPWEDQTSRSARLRELIGRRLAAWCGASEARRMRAASLFGGNGWNEELVLQRYELLYEAGLVEEAGKARPAEDRLALGTGMAHDHRRILATAIARLRAKIKYRPVVFELLPREFTMLDMQQTIEALAGQALHKPNFRRLVEQETLLEQTGAMTSGLAGRPARLFRFRSAIVEERSLSGSKLPIVR